MQVPERLGEPLLVGPQPLDLAHRVLEHGLGGQRRQAHQTCRVAGGVGDLAVGGAARDANGGGVVEVLLQLDQALFGDHRVVAKRHVGVRGAVGDDGGLGGCDLGALLLDLPGNPVDGLARGRGAMVDVVGDVLLGERERHVVGQLRRAEAQAHADQPRLRQRRHGGADEHPADDGGLGRRQRRQRGIDQRRVGRGRARGVGRPPAGDPLARGGNGAHDPAGLRRLGGSAADRAEKLGAIPERQPVRDPPQQRLRAQQGVLGAVPELLAVRPGLRVDDLLVLDHVGRHRRDVERDGGVVAALSDGRRPEGGEHAGGQQRDDEPAPQVDQAQPVGPLPENRTGGSRQGGVAERGGGRWSRGRVRRRVLICGNHE